MTRITKSQKKDNKDSMRFEYIYAPTETSEDDLRRAYAILFEETLKRLEAKGIHLSFGHSNLKTDSTNQV